MNRKLIVIPYRDTFFLKEFGYAVRDLQIVSILSKKKFFNEVVILNRPTSIYEKILGMRKQYEEIPGTNNVIKKSWNPIMPLFGRNWMRSCYNRMFISEINKKYNGEIWVLDFSPFAILPIVKKENVHYWHDMIDNFTKHNRFSNYSKKLVRNKYNYVSKYYEVLTGVSEGAIGDMNIEKKYLLNNGVFSQKNINSVVKNNEEPFYDFGFCGFITNKTDVDFLKKLREKGFTIIYHGKCFDESLLNELKELGIQVTGQFKYFEMEEKMNTFKIGLIPYKKEKSHDESPLKIYEYLKYNKPCLTSITYEVDSHFVVNYNEIGDKLDKTISDFLNISGKTDINLSIKEEWWLENKIETVLGKIMNEN